MMKKDFIVRLEKEYVELKERTNKLKNFLENIDNAQLMTYENQVAQLTSGVPQSEIATWAKQELEARGYVVDNTFPTPLIDSLCSARGVDKDYLVSKIIEKADLYASAIGQLTGLRQKQEDELGE